MIEFLGLAPLGMLLVVFGYGFGRRANGADYDRGCEDGYAKARDDDSLSLAALGLEGEIVKRAGDFLAAKAEWKVTQ